MTGPEVRQMILDSGLYLWQVAAALGITDNTFSRKLRFDFSDDETERIKAIVKELSE